LTTRRHSNGVPTLVRRQLGIRLKQHRERSGKTQEDAALGLIVHTSKIWRMETGRSAAKPGDVRELATIYGISRSETDELLELSRGAARPGWTDGYRDVVSDSINMYAGLEGVASTIWSFDPEFVPGVLQSPEYAWQVICTITGLPAEVKEKRLAFRMERQRKVFEREDPPQMRFVIGEAALRYAVGSPELMQRQLDLLVKLGETVDIRIRPFSAGLHRWMAGGGFILLKFPEAADPEVVYTETHIDSRYMETPQQIVQYEEIFDGLHSEAVPIREFAGRSA
jgi:transcriptional regulator with XRE-family HTH domain